MSDNPFSILDFLGYFFPGATVLIALYHYVPAVNHLFAIEEESSVMMYVVCIIASYVMGHIVALISSLTVEKYANWKYGYPSTYLLKSYSRGHYYDDAPMENDSIDDNSKNRFISLKKGMKRLMLYVLAPISLLDWVFSVLLGIDYYYTRCLSSQQISMIRAKCVNLYKALNLYSINCDIFQGDFHRIIHNYYYEKANTHSRRMENCIAIYDFLRAMSFVFVVLFYVALIKGIGSIDFSCPIDWVSVSFIFGFFGVSYLCYMGFMKFYRKFSVENFMCLICDSELNIVSTMPQNDSPTTRDHSQKQEDNDGITVK